MPSPNKSRSKKQVRYVIKCNIPVADDILTLTAFEKFLQDRIKVDGKTGVVGTDAVTLTRDDRKNELVVVAKPTFSKRYLKYLSKKFLKKQQLRDYIRVVADQKNAYELRYLPMGSTDEE